MNETSLSFSPVEHKNLEAEKRGLSKTNNPNIFVDEKTKQYYKWRDYQMYPQRVDKMYDTGAYTFRDSTRSLTYDSRGYCKFVEHREVKYYKPGWREFQNPAEIEEFEAGVVGYIKTFQEGVYCDKTGQNYFLWNAEKKSFEPTQAPKMPSLEPEPPKTQEVKPPTFEETSAKKADGIIDNFEQSKQTGDCWLISTIYGLSQNEEGKALLKEIIQPDENGNVTINLKGANKSYTFTNTELEEAIKSGKYANGDKDVAAIEMAVEKYKLELDTEIQAKAEEAKKSGKFLLRPVNPYRADYSKMYLDNPLQGGMHVTALAILTGKGSQNITKAGYEELHSVNHTRQMGGFNEETLKQYMEKPDQLIFASIKVNGGNHGVFISSMDDEFVYITDPHDTTKQIPKPRKEFFDKLLGLTITDLKSEPEEKLQNSPYNVKTDNSPEAQKYIDELEEKNKQ